MYVALLVLHLLICLALIGVVLVQSGKGGGLAGGAFGGSAQTVFGGRGATDFITRATMILGGLFFLTSLVLALMSSGLVVRSRSVLQSESRTQGPAQPGQVPARAPSNAPSTTPPAGTAPSTAPTTPPATPPAPPPSSGGH
jgi:preprotein translocase subunit SecG